MPKRNRTNPAPEQVQRVIDRYNMLPPKLGQFLPGVPTHFEELHLGLYEKRLTGKLSKSWNAKIREAVEGVSDLSVSLQQHVLDLDARKLERFLAGNPRCYKKLKKARTDGPGVYSRKSIEEAVGRLVADFISYIWNTRRNPRGNPALYLAERRIMSKQLERAVIAAERYAEYVTLRSQMHVLIDHTRRHPSWDGQFPVERKRDPRRQQMKDDEEVGARDLRTDFPLPLLSNFKYRIDKDGRLMVEADDFWKAFVGGSQFGASRRSQIDVRRIRTCQYCTRIFWAGRVNAYCCSEKCDRLRNSELFREMMTSEQRRERDRIYKREQRAAKKRIRL